MAASPRLRNALTLFSARDCVTCHRIRLVLAAKGVVYELVAVDPDQPPEDLLDINPTLSLPTLADRDLVLYSAAVLSEYIDERYPHPPLMPIDPLSRARLRLAMSRLEQEWIPELDAIAAGSRAESEAARKRMRELVQASLPLFKASRFFLNTELSLADCALAPILWRLPALGIDLARDAKPIEDYAQRIFRSPIFVRSLLPEERHYRELPA
ncbi:glutathione S-transferase N-terminal domain-containing protein [Aquimonas sp.]|jgi:RNA polymerase-associated protein|uniref:glutathione S-transferase N-terminal domain-containing protein n=1 Tax=Aquimonas sp. TaxID=1872588 RepID=UPI0037C17400